MTGEIVELFVLRSGDRWTVMSEGVARGSFDYQVDAEEAAIRLARGAQAKGCRSGVMSPGPGKPDAQGLANLARPRTMIAVAI